MADVIPVEVTHALDQAGGVIATDLPHAELFKMLAGEADLGDSLHSVAASERAIGIDAERERHVLYFVAVASDGTGEPALMTFGNGLR